MKATRAASWMEALFYQTQDLDLPAIAQALVLEYREKGYEAQHFGERSFSNRRATSE